MNFDCRAFTRLATELTLPRYLRTTYIQVRINVVYLPTSMLCWARCNLPRVWCKRVSFPTKEMWRYKHRGFSSVWPDLAKFRHFCKILNVLVYLLFGKILDLLWETLYPIGQIFVDVNGQMLKNNLVIWSHWFASDSQPVVKIFLYKPSVTINLILRL